jgi:ATP-dependent Clp protease ATP-binding subunit ClpA
MFERFDDEAMVILSHARTEARQTGHESIEPLHLLLALIDRAGGTLSPGLQRELGSPEEFRTLLTKPQEEDRPAAVPISPATMAVVERACYMDGGRVGERELLSALMEDASVRAFMIALGADPERLEHVPEGA